MPGPTDDQVINQALTKELLKKEEEKVLTTVLKMAQESLCPEHYEGFVEAYNDLITTRGLNLEKLIWTDHLCPRCARSRTCEKKPTEDSGFRVPVCGMFVPNSSKNPQERSATDE